jgi:hypothetical protein
MLVLVIIAAQRQKSDKLQKRFGPEYDRAVNEYGDKRHAEEELAAREKRVRSLDIRRLTTQERTGFANSWRDIQARFVDDPSGAIVAADRLVKEVMETRGYPMGDFEQRAADISVDHPHVVTNYRAARDIALKSRDGQVSTEELRQAMVHYRALFDDLLETPKQPARQEKEMVR